MTIKVADAELNGLGLATKKGKFWPYLSWLTSPFSEARASPCRLTSYIFSTLYLQGCKVVSAE